MSPGLKRRVVVTGIGAVTPLGLTFVDSWKALLLNQSGIVSLEQALSVQPFVGTDNAAAHGFSCQVAAPVLEYTPCENTNTRTTSRFVQMALTAAEEAIHSAGLSNSYWTNESSPSSCCNNDNDTMFVKRQQRAGVSIGSGMSGVGEIANATNNANKKLSPHFIPQVLGNSASARVSLAHHLRGPNLTAATACAAGAHAIGDAARCIQTNMADIMVAGGTESCLHPLALAGFGRLRALSTRYNEDPVRASRPFDRQRDGFVMGEGACVLVLEELEHARERLSSLSSSTDKAPLSPPLHFIELIGYGATGDAHHITSPDPNGQGAVDAMTMALLAGHSSTGDNDIVVDYVNAHATSTPKGDEIEVRAIQKALCGDINSNNGHSPVYVSSTKGATGHLLGAAGAMEAAFTIQSLLDQKVLHTKNLEDVNAVDGIDFVRDSPIHCEDFNVAMSNSFGFGGTNASLLFRRMQL